MNLSNINKAYLGLAATSVIWGSTWVASKIAVAGVPAFQVASIRQFSAGILFIIFFKLKGEPWPTRGQLLQLLIVSFFLLIIANGMGTWSVTFISSGLGALLGALYPLFAVTIEMMFFKVRTRPLTFAGLFIGVTGIAVVLYNNALLSPSGYYFWGIILGLVATLSWSVGTIMVARNKIKINPYYGMGWQMLLSSPVLLLMAFGTGQHIPLAEIPLQSWNAIAYLVLAGSCIAFVGFIYSMKYLPAAIASLYAYFNPIVAMLIGAFLLSEKLTPNILLGTIITITGVYLVNHSMREKITTVPVEKEV